MDDPLELTSRAEATHFWFHGFRSFVTPVVADLAGGRTNLHLIDCGCGTGYNLSLLRPYGRVYGFDLTRAGLDRARAAGRPLVRADIVRIPFASNTFDLATSFDVLQCVEGAEAAVCEMTRITRPGGAVLLTLAALEALRGDHAEYWREVRRYTPATATRLAEQAGLQVERVSFLFASLFPLMLAVRAGQRLLRPFRTEIADTDMHVPAWPVNVALTALVRGEARLARKLPMPVGSSLLVVGRKPLPSRDAGPAGARVRSG